MTRLLCSKCKEEKPPEAFPVRNERPRGRGSRCRDCLRSKRCVDCDKPVSARAIRCLSCGSKGERNPIFGTQRPAHVREAISQAQRGVPELRRGETHQSWKGDAASASAGRARANRMHPKPKLCEGCQLPKKLDWHHVDDDPLHNERENLLALCRRCHQTLDGRMAFLKGVFHQMGTAASVTFKPLASGPARREAHQAIRKAVESGVLVRPTACPECHLPRRVGFHHTDSYSKADFFVGEWLCDRCHAKRHLGPTDQPDPDVEGLMSTDWADRQGDLFDLEGAE